MGDTTYWAIWGFAAQYFALLSTTAEALIGIRGGGTSHDQGCDKGTKQGFAAASGVVQELKESEVERQLLL